MINLLLGIVLAAIAGGIIAYLVHEKKKGVTCIGCPYARDCAKRHNSQQCAKRKTGCGCGTVQEAKSPSCHSIQKQV